MTIGSTWMSRTRRLLATVALGGTVVGGLAACGGAPPETSAANNPGGAVISGLQTNKTFHGAEPPVPYPMPNVTLMADNGQPFNLITDTAYPVTLIFYGYSHCPDVCPLVLQDLAQTYLQLPKTVQQQTQVLFITTDPARDTDDVLRTYLAHFNPTFLGLRGSLAETKTAAQDMGVAITDIKRLPSGGYDVGHGAQVIGYRGNSAPVIWTEGTPVPDMVSDIEKLAGH